MHAKSEYLKSLNLVDAINSITIPDERVAGVEKYSNGGS